MSTRARWNVLVFLALVVWCAVAMRQPAAAQQPGVSNAQTDEEVARKRAGGLTCHAPDSKTMHASKTQIGCTDCHGGNAGAVRDETAARDSQAFADVKTRAHVAPSLGIWTPSGNPVRPAAATLQESLAFIRFVNPGDLRVVDQTCVPCHTKEVNYVRRSMMAHGAMLWGAALY